tara:strand:- start:111 stop:341 length:231 start_codon:yes stop_codon:yes gene_type:complete
MARIRRGIARNGRLPHRITSRSHLSSNINNDNQLFLDITDCVSGCGDHGQGTHSDNEDWRRDCFKSCTDTIHGQTN